MDFSDHRRFSAPQEGPAGPQVGRGEGVPGGEQSRPSMQGPPPPSTASPLSSRRGPSSAGPGVSNTRSRTPLTGEERSGKHGLSGSDPRSHLPNRERSSTPPLERHLALVGARVDALRLAFQGELRPEIRALLVANLARMADLKVGAPVEILSREGDVRGELSTRSREGHWLIENAGLAFLIDDSAAAGWKLVVTVRALLLMQAGPEAALALAREAARVLLADVIDERIRRLDLCADLTGFSVGEGGLDPYAFSIHHRTKYKDIARVEQYFRRGIRTGFMFGKSDAVARIYDKTEHLELGLAEDKAADECAMWTRNGWNGVDRVTRVEFQLQGRLLDELEIRSPDAALGRLDAVWAYCTHKWMRLVDLGSATRKDRAKTDRRWEILDRVVFRRREPPARRVRVTPVPQARRMVSAVINFGACVGAIAGTVSDPRMRVRDWSPLQCKGWVERELTRLTRLTLHAATADLFAQADDPREAVARLMEKRNAAAVRLAPIALCTLGQSQDFAA